MSVLDLVVFDSNAVQTIIALTSLTVAACAAYLSYRAFRRDSPRIAPVLRVATDRYSPGRAFIVPPPTLRSLLRYPTRIRERLRDWRAVWNEPEHLSIVLVVANKGRRTAQVAGFYLILRGGEKLPVSGGGAGFDKQVGVVEGDSVFYSLTADKFIARLPRRPIEIVAVESTDALLNASRWALPRPLRRELAKFIREHPPGS